MLKSICTVEEACSLRRVCVQFIITCGLFVIASCGKTSPQKHTVRIFAASSLSGVLSQLETLYESRNPGVDILLAFAGSQILRQQITFGAPADLFISAHPEHIVALQAEGVVRSVCDIARSQLALIVNKDTPAVREFTDLPKATTIVLGGPEVPVGRYARRTLRNVSDTFYKRVMQRVVSHEPNARLVTAKVALGEADAAVVYRSDGLSAAGVSVLPIPEEYNVAVEYKAAVLNDSLQTQQVQAFLRSEMARTVWAAHGFTVKAP